MLQKCLQQSRVLLSYCVDDVCSFSLYAHKTLYSVAFLNVHSFSHEKYNKLSFSTHEKAQMSFLRKNPNIFPTKANCLSNKSSQDERSFCTNVHEFCAAKLCVRRRLGIGGITARMTTWDGFSEKKR